MVTIKILQTTSFSGRLYLKYASIYDHYRPEVPILKKHLKIVIPQIETNHFGFDQPPLTCTRLGSPEPHFGSIPSSHCVSASMVGRSASLGGSSSGSGHYDSAMVDSSPTSTSKERVGTWPMDDLADVWDNCPLVRERLRSGSHFLMNYDQEKHVSTDGYVEKSIPTLKLNHFVLSPVLRLMGQNERTLPCIDRLLQQIGKLFDLAQVKYPKRGDRIYQDGWAIRRLVVLAKKQIYRPSMPKDLWGCQNECHLSIF